MRTALEQFGTVKNVEFIQDYLVPNLPGCALVEMESSKAAESVVSTITGCPFMISGMPRPVRAFLAKPGMFDDRPPMPGRRVTLQWLKPGDPGFEAAKKMKRLVEKHTAQEMKLHKMDAELEENLSKKQAEVLKSVHKKYDSLDGVATDGSARRLAKYYNMKLRDN
ncbi:hypothetical protein Tsubulata_001189 [Turnera subulata]|uniref:RRM domain-containing protein n=1 Tax=Turnera subulata TaxID=218843 RepID=A0A9Q0F8G2_9ROSI|nr:hypothetical protein Tsubulata_001189 [Turnera subulata]